MSEVLIHLDRVRFHHGAELILDGISWEIQHGQKIGLVGPNGAGKSTLLQLITGSLQPDAGIVVRHATRIGYLPQEPAFHGDETVWDVMLGANAELQTIERRMRALEAQMGDPAAFERALAAHTRAQEQFERLDGYRYESRCRQALQDVGFEESHYELPTKVLSGGQKKMLGLAPLVAIP